MNLLRGRATSRARRERLGSEVLLADAMQTRGDVWTSLTVIAALVGARLGLPILDPLAALVVAGFIGYAGYQIARATTGILSDRIVIADADLERVVMSVPGVLGCHQIRTRGSADHVFLDLHVWLPPDMRLTDAHALSHVVKDRLMARYPQIADAVIHIEPPPPGGRTSARMGVGSAGFDDDGQRDSTSSSRARRRGGARGARRRSSPSVDQPPARLSIAIGNAWSRAAVRRPVLRLAARPTAICRRRAWCSCSRATATPARRIPSSLGGGEADKHLIYEGLSRVAADAVLAGAETIRGGDIVLSVWHPELVALRASLGLPRHPIQIVATLRGLDLDDGLLFNVPELRVDRRHRRRAAPTLMRDAAGASAVDHAGRRWTTADDLPHARSASCGDMGIARISCIGGRTLARQLIDAGLIQDLYLTTSAKAGGEPDTPLYPRPLKARARRRKRGTGADDGVVFEHLATDVRARRPDTAGLTAALTSARRHLDLPGLRDQLDLEQLRPHLPVTNRRSRSAS